MSREAVGGAVATGKKWREEGWSVRRAARTDALSLGAELNDTLTASRAACLSWGSRLRSCARSAGKESEWLLALMLHVAPVDRCTTQPAPDPS